uniref:HAT C-terminal dimerisation domain-containing protein n=1 Tax=Latimeria chalumnae TaxID=7897 RepID=H3ABZ3_LATCH
FQDDWEKQFLVFLKEQVGVCAVCKKEIHQIKNTHADEVAKNYHNEFQRHKLLNRTKIELERQKRQIRDFLSKTDQIRMATFKVSFLLGQGRKPFSDGELIKKIVLTVQPENTLFQDTPLSNDTLQRSTQDLADFIQQETAEKVASSPFYSLCLDESNDVTKNAQVIVCVCFFACDQGFYCERVLCLATLCDWPTGKHIFESVKARMEECHISFNNLCGLTADRTAAMQSTRVGVLNYFQEICTQKLFMFHCFAHQEVLASEASMKTMDEVESLVKKSINAVNISSVNKLKFAMLCEMGSGMHNMLLNYNPIRWLSFNNCVQRLFELQEELIEVLTTISPELAKNLQDPAVYGCLLFLKEFLSKLASVNLELQKSQLTIFDSIEDESVQQKVCSTVTEYLKILSEDLEKHFSEGNFFHQYAALVTDSFNSGLTTSLDASKLIALQARLASFASVNLTEFKYLMLQMHNDARLKAYFSQPGVTVQEFWSNVDLFTENYKHLAKVALLFLSLFPTTVLYERTFSALHFLKSKYWNRLTKTNLEASLVVS